LALFLLVIRLVVLGIWWLIEPWRWDTCVVCLLAWQGVGVIAASGRHAALHLRAALRTPQRLWVEKPLEVGGLSADTGGSTAGIATGVGRFDSGAGRSGGIGAADWGEWAGDEAGRGGTEAF